MASRILQPTSAATLLADRWDGALPAEGSRTELALARQLTEPAPRERRERRRRDREAHREEREERIQRERVLHLHERDAPDRRDADQGEQREEGSLAAAHRRRL